MLNIAIIAASAVILTWLELPRMLREKNTGKSGGSRYS